VTPLDETIRNQRRAADPQRSAFVMANAGAGKTRVLTERVARLLLAKTPPQKILCITFTKAAAAEMADRLFETLGAWALAGDDALVEALDMLEGKLGAVRDNADLAEARRLFARALEAPGGLKIQTIHSFCEHTLRRFPLEAGAPPGFTVLEEGEAGEVMERALDRTARAAQRDEALRRDFARLSARHNEQDLRKLIADGARRRIEFDRRRQRFGGLDGLIAALAEELDAAPDAEASSTKAQFLSELNAADMLRAEKALADSGGNPAKICAPALARFRLANTAEGKWEALSALFLTDALEPRKKIATNATNAVDPWAKPFLSDLQAAFVHSFNGVKALNILHDTAAYLRVVAATGETYAQMKAARATLDFDDLIIGVEALFKNTACDWVMYKLDQGVDHVLVDEAQDTSPAQWAIIEALLKDFLSSAGAPGPDREFARKSLFAVGDMKQSIYSFQGADAELFEEKEASLGKQLAAVAAYASYDLALSFRSTAPVLGFVDQLFVEDGAASGFGQRGAPAHRVKREGDAGLVEIWPLTPRPEAPAANPWDAPVDAPENDHPARVFAARMADTIAHWLERDELLVSQDRPVKGGDILILVQSRGALFDNVIRALGRRGVPVAGADRLKLIEDPAVEDLLSYAKFALHDGDDLSLAETLKCPLFGFDDNGDLFPLAHNRAQRQSLWAVLRNRADEQSHWAQAAGEIAIARSIGLKEGPYAFFSHILETGAPSGRRRLYNRLSEAARDGVDELLRQALEFEKQRPRSLRAFVNWFEARAGEIKRQMERPGEAVRVMTVHGAKGLEANIVFLIDAHRGPNLKDIGPVFSWPQTFVERSARHLLCALAGSATNDVAVTAAAREDAKRKAYEEYRRLLYVAATRARDRLYVCGVESGNDKKPREKDAAVKSWHALALDALDRLGERVEVDAAPFWEGSDARARRLACAQSAAIERKPDAAPAPDIETPPWLFAAAQREAPPRRLAPSRLADEEEAATPADAPALSPTAGARYFRGRILHRLLELAPELAPEDRKRAADRLLARLAPQIDDAERAHWRDEVLAVLNDPQFAAAFGPGSRAEVALAGAPKGASPDFFISGQIDRLVVFDNKALAIDYKTNRPPPRKLKDIPAAYTAQMAAYRALLQEIYPDHQIDMSLLWTFEARLTPLPPEMLDHAFARYVSSG